MDRTTGPRLTPGASSSLGAFGEASPLCPLLCPLLPCAECAEEIVAGAWVHAHEDEEDALPPLWWHSRCWAAIPLPDDFPT